MKRKNLLLLIAFLWTFFTACLAQSIRYVKADGVGNGSSWEQASANIQAMIDSSTTGDQLWIAGGLYRNTGIFYLTKGVALYGGFAGHEKRLSERQLSSPSATTLTSAIPIPGGVLGTSFQAGQALIQIDGFYITGGRANGAGLTNYASNCRVVNCFFEANVASTTGGAIWNYAGLTALNCVFRGNRTVENYGGGGAIYNDSAIQVINCSFADNNTGGSPGRAIYNAGIATVTNSIFWHNGGSNTFQSVRNYGPQPNLTASYNLVEANVDYTTNTYSTYYTSSTDVRTGATPFADDQLRLRPSSVAIDAGDPASTTITSGLLDIAGQSRFYQNGRIDIGAYELQSSKMVGLVYSLRAGDWSDATIWSTGKLPTKEDVVQVRHLITIVDNFMAYGLSVSYAQDGQVIIGPNGKLNVGL